MRLLTLAVAALAVSALTTPPATADPEVEVLDCMGTLPADALYARRVTGTGRITCTHYHAGTAPSVYDEWFTSAIVAVHENDVPDPPATSPPPAYTSTGVLEFDGLGEHFSMVYQDTTVCGVMPLGGLLDQISFTSSSEFVYFVRGGEIKDAVTAPCVPITLQTTSQRSHTNSPATFRFVAEYAHEIPL